LAIIPIPEKAHHKNIINTFATLDIETMENPVNSGNQVAIAISLVFEDPVNKSLIKKLFINKDGLEPQNYLQTFLIILIVMNS
jgi:hypothetical protein